MFFRRNERLYEARIRDLKDAHAQEVRALNKVIDALAEQIEYLRATFGRPHLATKPSTPGLAWPPSELLDLLPTDTGQPVARQYLSEDEEDLLAMRESGLISDEELAAAQARLRYEQ